MRDMNRKNRMIMIHSFGIILLGCSLLKADPLPFQMGEKSEEADLGNDDFFTLQTVDFKEVYERNKNGSEKKDKGVMSLTSDRIAWVAKKEKKALAQACLMRAEEYMEAGELDEACDQIDIARLRDPDSILLLGRAAIIYSAAQRYQEASALFRLFLQHYPRQSNYLAAWGGTLIRLNEMDQAQVMLERAIVLDPDNVAAQFQLCILNILQDRDEVWLAWNRIALSKLRNVLSWLTTERKALLTLLTPEQFQRLGEISVGNGDSDELKKSLDLMSQLTKAMPNEGGDYEQIVEKCTQLLDMNINNLWLKIILAQAYFEEGVSLDAWRLIRSIQKENPTFRPAWYNGGFLALQKKEYKAAGIMYEKALRLEETGDCFFALACAYAGQGRHDDAWAIITQLNQTDRRALRHWLEGDKEYLQLIKSNPRYPELGIREE